MLGVKCYKTLTQGLYLKNILNYINLYWEFHKLIGFMESLMSIGFLTSYDSKSKAYAIYDIKKFYNKQ